MKKCKICGNIGVKFPDKICNDPKRDKSVICVVEDISDLWALEKTGSFKGLYHVLGGSLSALDNITPDDLMIKELIQRAKNNNIKEIILALNSTVNSQTTLHYITDKLNGTKVKITKIRLNDRTSASWRELKELKKKKLHLKDKITKLLNK